MEILNKLNQDIKHNIRSQHAKISFSAPRTIYFSTGATWQFGLSEGLRLHFVLDFDRAYIYFNNEDHGFPLVKRSSKSGLTCYSLALFRTLSQKNPKIKGGSIFKLKESRTKINGHPTIEMILSRN